MKKSLVVLTVTILTVFAFDGVAASAAVTSSTGKSDATIKFTPGIGVVTPPVDPENPDNPPPTIVDPDDPGNGGTGQVGPLSVDYVTNLKFGEHKVSGKNISYKAVNHHPFIQVSDLRGSGDGWSLSAKLKAFKNKNNHELKGATLSMKDGEVKAGSSSNISLAPISSTIIFNNEDSQLVMNAKDKSGRGTWIDVWSGVDQANEKVQLNVIAGTPEVNSEYSSSITWELEDAPK